MNVGIQQIIQPGSLKWQSEKTGLAFSQFLRNESWYKSAQVIKHNRKRTVLKVTPASGNYPTFYIKHFHPLSLKERIKSLWRYRAKMEFKSAMALAAIGILTVPIVAWGRKNGHSFLVTEEIKDALEFGNAWNQCMSKALLRKAFLDELGKFLNQLSHAKVAHPDLHSGNILVIINNNVNFCLVDLYGIQINKRITRESHQHLLGWLMRMSRDLEFRELYTLLAASGLFSPKANFTKEWRKLSHRLAKEADKRWRRRRYKLLKGSSICKEHITERGKWLLRPSITLNHAESAIGQYEHQINNKEIFIKKDTKRQLVRVQVENVSYIIKEFRKPCTWGRLRSDCRSWLNTYRLFMHTLPVVQSYAWLRSRDKRGFLVLEDVGSLKLSTVLAQSKSSRERRYLLVALAQLVVWIHDAGIIHGNMKLSNLMVREHPEWPRMPLVMIDSDSKNLYNNVSLKKRARNLCQIYSSLPSNITHLEQLRLLVMYRQHAGLSKKTLRAILGYFDHMLSS